MQILAFVLSLAASTSLVWSADIPSQVTSPKLIGVWQAVRFGVDCDTGQRPGKFISGPSDLPQRRHDDWRHRPFWRDGRTGSWQREPGNHNYSFRRGVLLL